MTQELNFEALEKYQPRSFVPDDADLTDLETVKGLYQSLIDRKITTMKEFEQWILDRSELEAANSQAGSILYIRMTCQTDDAERAEKYSKYIQTISPAISPLDHRLNELFLEYIKDHPLPKDRYEIYIKEIETSISIFREENIPLQTEVSMLSQEYQKVSGAMTVEFEGEERTLPQMNAFLQDTDRDRRESAWKALSERRLKDKDALEDIFSKMLKLRHKAAENAGFSNYRDFMFKALQRFDYTPQDCEQYHATVEKTVVPLLSKILEERKKALGVDVLRPWDLQVDKFSRKPLKPFTKADELISGCSRIFNKINSRLGGQFDAMAKEGLLDLDSRKGKAPGGYQSALSEARKPFIFMNAVGVDGDVRTLLHEAGHAFHTLACRAEPIVDYRHGPMEFNEVASMAMELLGDRYLDEFYTEEDLKRSKRTHFEDIIYVLPWVAIVDAFQHWIYLNPEHTVNDRSAKWIELLDRFSGGVVDWSGFEDVRRFSWHKQLHIFEVPFYYIEYGIAQLGALQLWRNAQENWDKALQEYCQALELGGSRPLPEIYYTAGIKFDFSEQTISPLMTAVNDRLQKL